MARRSEPRFLSTRTTLTYQSCTCQCNLCRKFTGALISHDVIIKPEQISDISKASTYKEYRSSEAAVRTFCSNCGSGLTWKIDYVPDMVVLFMGTIDEEFLIGKKVEGSEKETPLGVEFKRDGGLSKELASMNLGHLFWNNAIPGVSDHVVGEGALFPQSFPQEMNKEPE
jgi:hypothetical protein